LPSLSRLRRRSLGACTGKLSFCVLCRGSIVSLCAIQAYTLEYERLYAQLQIKSLPKVMQPDQLIMISKRAVNVCDAQSPPSPPRVRAVGAAHVACVTCNRTKCSKWMLLSGRFMRGAVRKRCEHLLVAGTVNDSFWQSGNGQSPFVVVLRAHRRALAVSATTNVTQAPPLLPRRPQLIAATL
jgi:hypothetical protein